MYCSALEVEHTRVRVLRLSPLEALLSFICSSNNNIARITQLVESLARIFGRPLLRLDSRLYYELPALERLASADALAQLRDAKFGYRAQYLQCGLRCTVWASVLLKWIRVAVLYCLRLRFFSFLLISISALLYISETARTLLERGGDRFLDSLVCPPQLQLESLRRDADAAARDAMFASYREAHAKLLDLRGVGPKVHLISSATSTARLLLSPFCSCVAHRTGMGRRFGCGFGWEWDGNGNGD